MSFAHLLCHLVYLSCRLVYLFCHLVNLSRCLVFLSCHLVSLSCHLSYLFCHLADLLCLLVYLFCRLANYFVMSSCLLGSISSRCSENEPTLIPRKSGWTRAISFVGLSQSCYRLQIFIWQRSSQKLSHQNRKSFLPCFLDPLHGEAISTARRYGRNSRV